MKFMIIIYTDPALMDALPEGRVDEMLRDCFAHTDVLQREGVLLESRMLGPAAAFAEAKEVLGGFNLIEAADIDEALRIAAAFPWSAAGSVEVRPVEDLDAVRRRVGHAAVPAEQEASCRPQ